LAKDSTNQLFDKDYNWLCVILGGLMKAKIRNEMVEGLAFSTASAAIESIEVEIFPKGKPLYCSSPCLPLTATLK
jgi:hypothetical protein